MTNTIDTNDDDRLRIYAKSRPMLDMLAEACGVSPDKVQQHVVQSPDGGFYIDVQAGPESKPDKPRLC